MLAGLTYEKITEEGLWINQKGESKLIVCDNIIICAGQLPANKLKEELDNSGISNHIIGGARKAAELDAKAAIEEGTFLAYSI